MKIEIGESLVRTWMRHCRECQFAELNWKPSPIWNGLQSPEHEQWFDEAKAIFPSQTFKQTTNLSQLLRQAEIDVLGVRFAQKDANEIVAADIGFHSSGLLYGSNKETAARVAKKYWRTALLLDVFFRGIPAEIAFLSPKVNASVVSRLQQVRDAAQSFYDQKERPFTFTLLINDDFKTEIFAKVIPLAESVADTSELFLRAIQLAGLFGKTSNRRSLPRTATNSKIPGAGVLPIELIPADPETFKKRLLEQGRAMITEYYANGEIRDNPWVISKFSSKSNVLSNLRSRPDYRNKVWQTKGLTKLVVRIEEA